MAATAQVRYPTLSPVLRLARLAPPPGPVRLVLDTDAANEIDDQFAIAYALLSSPRLRVEHFSAAPFTRFAKDRRWGNLSATPAEGMEKSYREFSKLLELAGAEVPLHRGSTRYLPGPGRPVESEAARQLVARALASPVDDPLYVVANSCPVNVASAILLEPEIIKRIVVLWVGGNSLPWPHTRVYNVQQDLHAARVLLDSGVPLVHFGCLGVTSHLQTNLPQMQDCLAGRGGPLTAYLYRLYRRPPYRPSVAVDWVRAKVLWAIAPIAYLKNPAWLPSSLAPSPRISDYPRWVADPTRHLIRDIYHVRRDPIMADLFACLTGAGVPAGQGSRRPAPKPRRQTIPAREVETMPQDPPAYPELAPDVQVRRLEPPTGPVRMILDTDTFNEIDDQFAVVYALLAQERLTIEAFTAAPFHNSRSSGPADGMEQSYQELLRIRELMDAEHPVHRGADAFMPAADEPVESDAARAIVEHALAAPADAPLYVVPIGAITNVASAILLEPGIIEKIVVVWLGGHAHHWPATREFNLRQDLHAARVIFACGVPLVQIPCMGVTSHLQTTLSQVRDCVAGHGEIGRYLYDIYEEHTGGSLVSAKVLWDISAIAYLLNPEWLPSVLVHSPRISEEVQWVHDPTRHFIRCVYRVNRTAIFRDLFERLEAYATD